ncbi:3473_t:CDS:2, partial [Ambispora leptoticha]
MQRHHEEGSTPPPPYTLVDHLNTSASSSTVAANNNNNTSSSFSQNQTNGNNTLNITPQYHSQNPYPATVISTDSDYRLAQKLQEEEYALGMDQNPYEPYPSRRIHGGESSTSILPTSHHQRVPMPPIPEHYTCNYHHSYQNSGGTTGNYYSSAQSHPFYNAPYYNYQQQHHQHLAYQHEEEEDNSPGCLTG